MQILKYTGEAVVDHIQPISEFRILYFKEFPYCYQGNYEYEKEYFLGFSQEKNALVIELLDKGQTIGLSTAMPLVSDADILKDAEAAFVRAGSNPLDYYYLGEVILHPDWRGKGLVKKILQMNEVFALENGFSKMCLSVVIRDEFDPRKPQNYRSSDHVWEKAGYLKKDIFIDYHWPTILEDGSVKELTNPMVFWTKSLR